MRARRYCLSAAALLLVAAMAACGSGNANSSSNNNGNNNNNNNNGGAANLGIKSVNHFIVMMQENRSFDHYFGKLNDYRQSQGLGADLDGLPANASNVGFDNKTVVNSFHLKTECTEDLSSFWDSSIVSINLENPNSGTAKMDGFAWAAGHFATDENAKGDGPYTDTLGARAMGYYDQTDLGYYYFMATQFATSDRWFSPVMTRSQPNHLYLYAATSQGHVYPPTGSDGLTAKTIFEELDAAGVSWKIYESDPGTNFLTYFHSYYAAHSSNVVPATQFATDAANGTLPAVAFIEGGYNSGRDEHPRNKVQAGMQYVSTLINALMQSASWKDSVFVLTWDEGGGFYDHVPPVSTVSPDGIKPVDLQSGDFQGDFTSTGFRLPLIVASPFAKKGYVSHTATDYTAVLKFIETRWNVPALTKRDAAQMDMTEFFDWSAPNANPPTPPAAQETLPCAPSQMQ